MSGQRCALAGCSKACACAQHLTCGELHHLLLMAGRYNSAPPHPYQAILDRNDAGLCALASCSKPPWPGHPWCSRTHYLSWLCSFYASLSPLQICKIPDCTRHVYVSDADNALPSEFCGWRHCQKFTMLNARQQQPQYQPPSTQREYGHLSSIKSLMHALKHFALYQVTPQSVKVDTEFFTKHPWEVLADGESCYVIAQCKFTGRRKTKQRDMVTKDHYHWKQQGPPKEKNGYWKKYFSYRKLKGKKEQAVQHYGDTLYTMKEYTMDDVESYCLVKICKGGKKVCKGGKRRKREDDIGYAQDCVTSASPSVEDDLFEDWPCSSFFSDDLFQFVETSEEPLSVDDLFEDWPCSSSFPEDALPQLSCGLYRNGFNTFCPT